MTTTRAGEKGLSFKSALLGRLRHPKSISHPRAVIAATWQPIGVAEAKAWHGKVVGIFAID